MADDDKKAGIRRDHEPHGKSEEKGTPRGGDGAKAIVIDPTPTGDTGPDDGTRNPSRRPY